MKIKEIIKNKKLVIRIILFIAALTIAAIMFSRGVLGLSNNKEGYQTINASPCEDALLYANDFTFNYFFTGSSGEIREKSKLVTAEYSAALERAYKLLDTQKTYDGYVNLASVNFSAMDACGFDVKLKKADADGSESNYENNIDNRKIKVSSELYGILKDAYEKTMNSEDYNMFAGALYSYVNNILILDEPAPFDPLNNQDTQNIIEKLVKLLNNKDLFSLKFINDTDCTISFSISPEYYNEITSMEIDVWDAVPLNLNLLKDAYTMQIVCDALKSYGYTNGYISTKSGLTVTLSKQEGMEFCVYGLKDNTMTILETIPSEGEAVYSSFKAFGFGDERMFYTVNDNGQTIYRSPYISSKSGYSSDKYLSLYTILKIGNDNNSKNGITGTGLKGKYIYSDAVYRNLNIWSSPEYITGDTKSDDVLQYQTVYVLQSEQYKAVHPG